MDVFLALLWFMKNVRFADAVFFVAEHVMFMIEMRLRMWEQLVRPLAIHFWGELKDRRPRAHGYVLTRWSSLLNVSFCCEVCWLGKALG